MNLITIFEIFTKTSAYLSGEDIEITDEDTLTLKSYGIEWTYDDGIEVLDKLVSEKIDDLLAELPE